MRWQTKVSIIGNGNSLPFKLNISYYDYISKWVGNNFYESHNIWTFIIDIDLKNILGLCQLLSAKQECFVFCSVNTLIIFNINWNPVLLNDTDVDITIFNMTFNIDLWSFVSGIAEFKYRCLFWCNMTTFFR